MLHYHDHTGRGNGRGNRGGRGGRGGRGSGRNQDRYTTPADIRLPDNAVKNIIDQLAQQLANANSSTQQRASQEQANAKRAREALDLSQDGK